MSASQSPFGASASALGYLYQCRYALLLALQKGDDLDLGISVENLDDVAFHEPPSSPDDARELIQFKHHVGNRGTLGDGSPDIWKSLNIWSEGVQARRIDVNRVTLCLVTTSHAGNSNAVHLLRPAPAARRPLEALDRLMKAGARSKNPVVIDAFARFVSLTESDRRSLMKSVVLLDGASNAIDLDGDLRAAVRYAADPRHRDALVQRLEGWWLHCIVRHLCEPVSSVIPVSMIQRKVYEIAGDFRRERLPDDVAGTLLPGDATPDEDERTFVRQLSLIGLSEARRRYAQADHFRAFTQRSKWVKDQLMDLEETASYEARLVEGWRERFAIMRESVPAEGDGPTRARHGHRFYDWIVSEAPTKGSFWVRPDFQAEYMTKGSYHILADVLRVGWHPDYEGLLSTTDACGEGDVL